MNGFRRLKLVRIIYFLYYFKALITISRHRKPRQGWWIRPWRGQSLQRITGVLSTNSMAAFKYPVIENITIFLTTFLSIWTIVSIIIYPLKNCRCSTETRNIICDWVSNYSKQASKKNIIRYERVETILSVHKCDGHVSLNKYQ